MGLARPQHLEQYEQTAGCRYVKKHLKIYYVEKVSNSMTDHINSIEMSTQSNTHTHSNFIMNHHGCRQCPEKKITFLNYFNLIRIDE